jgi:hypothetical protein
MQKIEELRKRKELEDQLVTENSIYLLNEIEKKEKYAENVVSA